MPSIDEVFTSNTLKADDIRGREPTVTIAAVEPREFKGRDGKIQNKLIITFQRAKKPLVCNKTNAKRIAAQHGKDYAKWIGKQITLYVDPFVEFGGEITEGVRVKLPQQSTSAAALPADDPMPDTSQQNKPVVMSRGQATSENPAEGLDDPIPF